MLEIVRDILFENGRRERPEIFPELHPCIQNFLHLGIAGIGEDASATKRSWTEFHAVLKPADNEIIIDQPGRVPYQFLRFELAIFRAKLFQRLTNGVIGKGRTDARIVRAKRQVRPAATAVVSMERGADRAAAVARCRMDEHLGKAALAKNPRIRHDVVSDAACQTQIRRCRSRAAPRARG